MIRFFIANFVCVAVLCFIFYGVAHAEPSIERTIDGKTIILNALKCDDGGFRLYRIENNVAKSGCFENDGKYVLETIDGVVTKYDKRLFELAVQ
jgi:hypothetical protein